MRYLATDIRNKTPILIVEAINIDQAKLRVKGAMHTLGMDSSISFDCQELGEGDAYANVPVFFNDFFELLGFQ
jgi:hypothetical protein